MIVATPVIVHNSATASDVPAWEIRNGRAVHYVHRVNYTGYIPIGVNCRRPLLGHYQLGSTLVTSLRVVQPPPARSGRTINVLPADYIDIPQDWYASESLVEDFEVELEDIVDEDQNTEDIPQDWYASDAANPPTFDVHNFPTLVV